MIDRCEGEALAFRRGEGGGGIDEFEFNFVGESMPSEDGRS